MQCKRKEERFWFGEAMRSFDGKATGSVDLRGRAEVGDERDFRVEQLED
jgi:hypothetical protein